MSYKVVIAKTGTAAALVLLAAACKGQGSSAAAGPATVTAVAVPSSSPALASQGSPVASAGVASAPSAPVTSGSPVPSASYTSCATAAATEKFVYITAAAENADGSLTLTVNPATLVCGGPDDLHYDVATSTETSTVTPSGTVQVLVEEATGPQDETVAHSALSSTVEKNTWGNIFQVTGPLTDVTALAQMYHP